MKIFYGGKQHVHLYGEKGNTRTQVVNCDKAVLTGNKINQKLYRTHSGYIGGLKETSYKKLMAERPEFAMKIAVKGMLPKNSIGDKSLTRLRVYRGSEHGQQAQKPVPYEV